MVAAYGCFFNESLDFLIGTGDLLPALALDIEILAALTRAGFTVVLKVLTFSDYFTAGHVQYTLQEVFGLDAVACLLREIIDFKL